MVDPQNKYCDDIKTIYIHKQVDLARYGTRMKEKRKAAEERVGKEYGVVEGLQW